MPVSSVPKNFQSHSIDQPMTLYFFKLINVIATQRKIVTALIVLQKVFSFHIHLAGGAIVLNIHNWIGHNMLCGVQTGEKNPAAINPIIGLHDFAGTAAIVFKIHGD